MADLFLGRIAAMATLGSRETIMGYDRDYSVLEVKKLIALSEGRDGKWNQVSKNHGHAFRDHQGISDANVIAKKKSAFISQANFGIENFSLDPSNLHSWTVWKKVPINDQAFLVANILNSPYGQAALSKLNTALGSRVTLSAVPPTLMGKSFNLRAKAGGVVDSSSPIGRILIIVENGFDDLHFVTAYPKKADVDADFGIWPGVMQSLAFGTFRARGKTQQGTMDKKWMWTGAQTDSSASLRLVP